MVHLEAEEVERKYAYLDDLSVQECTQNLETLSASPAVCDAVGSLVLLIAALAKPQSSSSWRNQTIEGIDIIIALDISGSMLARDFQPNRLEAAKNVASEFIAGREFDRMGLVIFSAELYPMSFDNRQGCPFEPLSQHRKRYD